MGRFSIAVAASAALAAVHVAPLHAQEAALVFERDGPWSLDAGEDSCRLARSFARGEDTLALALERNRADNMVRLVLVSDVIRTFRTANQIGYSYLPDGAQRTAFYARSETPDGTPYFNLGNAFVGPDPFASFAAGAGAGGPSPRNTSGDTGDVTIPPYDRAAEREYAAGITGISLGEGLLQPIRIETGSLGGAIEALQACTDDLLRSWGLDWEAHQTMTRRAAPIGPAYEWIPRTAVTFADTGKFVGANNPFRVMVDATGKPTSCHVHWPTLDARQNEAVCEGIMANGAFTPALDANGEPMASYWMTDYFPALSRPFGH